MPEGQLADSWVGWDGEWFIIERKVRSGPRALEKFRLTKTGQLEYMMKWSGDSELSGIKVRRLYDRRSRARAGSKSGSRALAVNDGSVRPPSNPSGPSPRGIP